MPILDSFQAQNVLSRYQVSFKVSHLLSINSKSRYPNCCPNLVQTYKRLSRMQHMYKKVYKKLVLPYNFYFFLFKRNGAVIQNAPNWVRIEVATDHWFLFKRYFILKWVNFTKLIQREFEMSKLLVIDFSSIFTTTMNKFSLAGLSAFKVLVNENKSLLKETKIKTVSSRKITIISTLYLAVKGWLR